MGGEHVTTGQRIKNLRINKGLSQEELGEMIGVKKAAINKYETDIVVNLKRSTISKLASALGTSPIYLMGWDDESEIPATKSGSGLSDEKKYLISCIYKMSDENVHKLRIIVEQVIDQRDQ